MENSLFGSKAELAAITIKRAGVLATVLRADGTETENDYGKVEDDERTYNQIADVHAARIYGSETDRPRDAGVLGGRLGSENPRIAFRKDADVQEDDRVEFPDTGRKYVLEAEIPYHTHTEYRATLINE